MTVMQAVPADRLDAIAAEAREVDAGQAVLGVIAAVLIAVGRCLAVLSTAVVWSYVAVRTGYRDVRPPRRREVRAG